MSPDNAEAIERKTALLRQMDEAQNRMYTAPTPEPPEEEVPDKSAVCAYDIVMQSPDAQRDLASQVALYAVEHLSGHTRKRGLLLANAMAALAEALES